MCSVRLRREAMGRGAKVRLEALPQAEERLALREQPMSAQWTQEALGAFPVSPLPREVLP